jgi:hypothetical protein
MRVKIATWAGKKNVTHLLDFSLLLILTVLEVAAVSQFLISKSKIRWDRETLKKNAVLD